MSETKTEEKKVTVVGALRQGAFHALRTFYDVVRFLILTALVLGLIAGLWYLDHVRFMR